MGFIGRLHPKKNLALVISALSQLSHSVTLTIAGDGPSAIKILLLDLAKEKGVQGRIEWLGFVEGTSKEEFFQHVDLLAMPSDYESFGLVAAEAMVRGVPPIVTVRSGIAEIIQQFGGGLVCEPLESDFSRQLQKFEEDRALLPRLSKEAIDVATRHLSFSAFGRGLKQQYLSILFERGDYDIARPPLRESNAP